MKSYVGYSEQTHTERAVAELTASWPAEPPSLVLVFSSTRQDARGLRQALEARYPSTILAGCTTSGEHVLGSHRNGSVGAAALYTPRLRWTTQLIAPLSSFSAAAARDAVDAAFAELEVKRDELDPSELVAVLLCDGLSRKEELVAGAVAEALDGVPVVGGSAGDDLAFKQTLVSMRGTTRSDAAVLLVGRGPKDFYQLLKHQHFVTRPTAMAVTRADVSARRVYELDGQLAADTYARALGIPRERLPDEAFLNPVVITVQGKPYVRSVQSVNNDGSLTFYCAVEEGWILDLAGHQDMQAALATDVHQALERSQRAGFFLGFNCILRALEADKRALHPHLEATLADVAEASLCFDTYGEVTDGLHINQTLVGLLLSAAA